MLLYHMNMNFRELWNQISDIVGNFSVQGIIDFLVDSFVTIQYYK